MTTAIRPLETPRLILRPLELADAERVQELFPHWDIVKYLGAIVPWPYPEGAALAYFRDQALPAISRGDEWHWTLRLKSDPGRLIGCITLRKSARKNRGFWLGLPWHEQGLMSEAVEAVTTYWFDELGLPLLRVSKAAANLASRRISEKQGMRVIGVEQATYVCGPLSAEIWEITAEEWRQRRKRRDANSGLN